MAAKYPYPYSMDRKSSICVHAAQEIPETQYGSLATPIYQTANYVFKDVDDGAKKCESVHNGYCYTRLGNPTLSVLEQKVAALEGSEAALCFASGVAAISSFLFSVLQSGDHVVADGTTYSATNYLFGTILKKFGVETTFVNTSNLEEIEPAIRPNTKLIYTESPANPTVKMTDLAAMAKIGKAHGIMTATDNTFASPILQRPIEFGIDVVIESATKYLNGHEDVMAGIICGTQKLMDTIRDDTMKNMGGVLGPFEAYLVIRGIKTMDIRVKQMCATAMQVAQFLERHPKISRVYYPGLLSHPQHELGVRQMEDFGGMICFEIEAGLEAGITFMNSLQFCRLAVSLGDVDTELEHPASMTHWYVPKEERLAAGITDGLVRLSIGLEDAEDIIADLDQALAQI
jgi:methionine-gamma-lyase